MGPAARAALLPLLALAGCLDLREYTGTWQGEILADPALGHGFAPGTGASVEVADASRDGIALVVTLGGRSAPFVPIRRAAGDALAEVQLPGEPVRTFFGFVALTPEAPHLAVVSLYPDPRIELRLIRGADDAYAVFSLRRPRSGRLAAPP